MLSRDPSALRWELLWFKPPSWAASRCPRLRSRSAEERYELLRKLQAILHTLGYAGIIVLIDRVDEPQQVEGDPRKMRSLIWPLLDHKFLRHPGIGVKLLLPIELAYYLEKEDKEFYDRARPDKLNLIKPLRWTGASLYDLASDRLSACRIDPLANGQALGCAASSTTQSATTISATHWGICEHPGTSSSSCTGSSRSTATGTPTTPLAGRSTTTPSARRTADYMRELEAFDRGYGHG